MKIVKNDTVRVIRGAYKGVEGRVLRVLPGKNRVVVEKVNLRKRHTRPSQDNPQGGIVEKELPIEASNVMVIDPESGEPTRVGYTRLTDGEKVRVAKRSGEMLSPEK
jgi:large subunit ribosomal protein L24